MQKLTAVYILTSKPNGTLYIGVTTDLLQRIYQHRQATQDGFTQRYSVYSLVYFETFDSIRAAIEREKQLKKWNRAWKIRLIETNNPLWKDLRDEI
jgi:putative endonuclease